MPRGLDKVIIGGLLIVLAGIPWMFRQGIASQFASEYIATLDLRTSTERDDKRVTRAFAAAVAALQAKATITPVQSELKVVRKSTVRVSGTSRDAALAAAQSVAAKTVAAFNAEGPGRLDTHVSAYVMPVLGSTGTTVLWSINIAAALVAIAALAFMVIGWRQGRAEQPDAKVMELPGTLALVVLAFSMIPLLVKGCS